MDILAPALSIELIGVIAGCLTTIAYVPQVVAALRTRSTKDISLVMYAIMCTGVLLWLIYGALIQSWPLIGANLVSLLLAGTVLALKLRYGGSGA